MVDQKHPSFSIVIETDNLAQLHISELFRCLDGLESQGDVLHRAMGVFVADGGIVPEKVLREICLRYPWVTVVRARENSSYMQLKLAGVLETDSEVIVFCDSDVRYEPGWLEALLEGFCLQPGADLIAGETTTAIRGPYSLAFALTFNFPRFSNETELARSGVYWANNFAVRRETLTRVPFPDLTDAYRGQSAVHSAQILRCNGVIVRSPLARGLHAVTPVCDVLKRYLILGRDAAAVRRITDNASGGVYLGAMAPDRPGEGVLGRLRGRVSQIARSQPRCLALFPLAIPFLMAMGAAYVAGRIIGMFDGVRGASSMTQAVDSVRD